MKNIRYYILLAISVTTSVYAGGEFLYLPHRLFGKNQQDTLNAYIANNLPTDALERGANEVIGGENYFLIPYAEAAVVAIYTLIEEQEKNGQHTWDEKGKDKEEEAPVVKQPSLLSLLPQEIVLQIVHFIFSGLHGEEHLKNIRLVSKEMHSWYKLGFNEANKSFQSRLTVLLERLNTYMKKYFLMDEGQDYQGESVIAFLQTVAATRVAELKDEHREVVENWILRNDHAPEAINLRIALARILLYKTGRFQALVRPMQHNEGALVQCDRCSLLGRLSELDGQGKASLVTFEKLIQEISKRGLTKPQELTQQTLGDLYYIYKSLIPTSILSSEVCECPDITLVKPAQRQTIRTLLPCQIIINCLVNRLSKPSQFESHWREAFFILLTYILLRLEDGEAIEDMARVFRGYWDGVIIKFQQYNTIVHDDTKIKNEITIKRDFLGALADYLEMLLLCSNSDESLKSNIKKFQDVIWTCSIDWVPKESLEDRTIWYDSFKERSFTTNDILF